MCVLVRPSELYAIKKTHHGFSFRRAVNAYGRTANDAGVSVRSFNSLKPFFGCCVHISQRYTVYCFCGLVDPDRNPQGPSPARTRLCFFPKPSTDFRRIFPSIVGCVPLGRSLCVSRDEPTALEGGSSSVRYQREGWKRRSCSERGVESSNIEECSVV